MRYISPFRMFRKNKVALIIHGYGVNYNECFYPWLKNRLEKLGYKVELPDLPNSQEPNINDQVNFILKNYPDKKNIIIGHSLGACTAMKIVEKINYKIDSLFLISGFIDCNFSNTSDEEHEILLKSCDWKFNFDDIKSKSDVYILRPEIDSEVNLKQTEEMAKAFNVPINFFESIEDHACGEEEPEIFKFIKNNI